jgi:hypothetical protein
MILIIDDDDDDDDGNLQYSISDKPVSLITLNISHWIKTKLFQ